MLRVAGVRFKDGGKIYYYEPSKEHYEVGDKIIVETVDGNELGELVYENQEVSNEQFTEQLRKIIRKASDDDINKHQEMQKRVPEITATINQAVKKLNLDMKVVGVTVLASGNKILIEFIAENRVDFRDLLKNLAGTLRARIELKQIGQRDEVKCKGGLGICGEVCCCKRFLNDFEHVSIKMAKNQGLALNPTKISGLCGKLLCCLAYENPNYEQILKKLPKINQEVETSEGNGIVVYNEILREKVHVKIAQGRDDFVVKDFDLADIKVRPVEKNKKEGEK